MIPNVFCRPKQITLDFGKAGVLLLVIVLEVQHIKIVHYGHDIRKYGQILKNDFEIFIGIDYYKLSLF